MSYENRDISKDKRIESEDFKLRRVHFKVATLSKTPNIFILSLLGAPIGAAFVFGTLALNADKRKQENMHISLPKTNRQSSVTNLNSKDTSVDKTGFYRSTYFGIDYLAVDPEYPTQIGNTFLFADTGFKEQNITSRSAPIDLDSPIPKSKIASVQGPIIPSDDESTITLSENVSNRVYWSTYSFTSNPLPNPIGLKFTKPAHAKIFSKWRPAIAITNSYHPSKLVVIDQLDRFDHSQMRLRYSVARPISKMNWDNSFPEIKITIFPGAILAGGERPIVLTNVTKSQILTIRSLQDISVGGVLLSLSNLQPKFSQTTPDWIAQRIPANLNLPYKVYLSNGKDTEKFISYLSQSIDFDIEKSVLDPTKEGTFLIDDGKVIASIYGKSPTSDEIKKLGKTSGASFAFTGKLDDFVTLPRSVRDRLQLVSKVLTQIETIWLIESNRIVPVTKDDLDSQPSLIGSLIRNSSGILLHPLSVVSVYN